MYHYTLNEPLVGDACCVRGDSHTMSTYCQHFSEGNEGFSAKNKVWIASTLSQEALSIDVEILYDTVHFNYCTLGTGKPKCVRRVIVEVSGKHFSNM